MTGGSSEAHLATRRVGMWVIPIANPFTSRWLEATHGLRSRRITPIAADWTPVATSVDRQGAAPMLPTYAPHHLTRFVDRDVGPSLTASLMTWLLAMPLKRRLRERRIVALRNIGTPGRGNG